MTRILSTVAGVTALIFASAGASAATADWDDNNDGIISNEEFMEEYDEDFRDFSQWDTDKDRMISPEEFRAGVFSIYDVDESGDLSETEYKIFQEEHWGVGTRGQIPKPGDVEGRNGAR